MRSKATSPTRTAAIRRPARGHRAGRRRAKAALVDAEVGALLRVLAIAVGAQDSRDRHRHRLLRNLAGGALPADGMLDDDGNRPRTRTGSTGELRARRPGAARQRHSRRRPAHGRQGLRTVLTSIFQDGDKKRYVPLLDRLVSLLRPGGLLVTDNVLWDGKVVPGFTEGSAKAAAQGSSKDMAERSAKASAEMGADDENTRAIVEHNEKCGCPPGACVDW